ncbi:MAG: DoxX family protein [Nitrospirae bacterium]|nr:MAG: DoxX family protein [Nitrospirota bacterium]
MSSTIESGRAPSQDRIGKVLNIILWVLQVAAAAILFMAGVSKLSGTEQMVGLFEKIGIGPWFRFVTGGLEALGSLALLVPPLAGASALVLGVVMAGAVATHLFVIGGSPAMALGLLSVMAVVAWGRRDRTVRLLRAAGVLPAEK